MVRIGNEKDFNDVMIMLSLCKEEMKERGLFFWNDSYPDSNIIMADLKSGNSVVYELDGKVIAFLVMCPKKSGMNEALYHEHDNYCYISRVMVSPLYRRCGYAQKILKYPETMGFNSLRLLTRNTNVYSVNLYLKLGYQVVKSENKDNVIMQHCEKIL